MKIKCKICENKKTNIIKQSLYHCSDCDIKFTNKIYNNDLEYINEFQDNAFVQQRNKIFYEFFLHKIIKKMLNKNLKILDIGCATGDFLKLCNQLTKWELTGIDTSWDLIRQAKEKKIIAKFFVGDIVDFTKENNDKFNIIFCSHTLEHINNPKLFINYIKKLLYRDGLVYIEVPNERTNFFLWRDINYNRDALLKKYTNHPIGHICFYNKKSLTFLLKDFQILEIINREFPYNFSRSSNIIYRNLRNFLKKLVFFILAKLRHTARIIVICKKM